MAHLISISENISSPQRIGDPGDVYATAEASFDCDSSRLQVKLASFRTRPGFEDDGDQPPADWLPQPITITESMSREEATLVTKEIFNNWLREVQGRIAARPQDTCDQKAAPR